MTAGVDGWTVATVTGDLGAAVFRMISAPTQDGDFSALPVRQRMIPKPADRVSCASSAFPRSRTVVQAALKLVLEPTLRPTFCRSPIFRPQRRAHDAIADIHRLAPGYQWGWTPTSRRVST